MLISLCVHSSFRRWEWPNSKVAHERRVNEKTGARLKYYGTLENASVNNQLELFVDLIAECVEESLHRYIAVVTPAEDDG